MVCILPGCFSAGDSYDDAIENAREAIECHLEGILMDGEVIPVASQIDSFHADKDFKDGVWALVEVDIKKLSGKVTRVNITIPERILHQLDHYAATHGESRSVFFANAALEYIAKH